MKKKVWISISVVAVLALIIGFNVYRTSASKSAEVETGTLESENINTTVMTPGTLTLANESLLFEDPSKGELTTVHVEEGDAVKKGDNVLTYENPDLKMEKEQNDINIESLYLRINSLDKQKTRLQEKEDELADDVGREEAEETMEAELDQIQMDIRMANLDLRQALLQRDRLKERMSELTVTSEIDGVVIEVNESSSPTTQGEKPLIRLGSMNDLVVKGKLSEYDTLSVDDGQSVTLTSDAVPDQEWKGKVSEVAYLPETTATESGSSAVQFPVTVTIDDGQKLNLKPGFQMIVEIETESHQAMTLPFSSVLQDGDDQYVYAVEGGKAVRKDIKTGSSTAERIEVTSGVTKDDQVVIDPPGKLKDGMDVSVK
ncbi:efflux RND transporter periplasmic adaptor subunit [Alkalihalobacillus sp. CinArs1]|uniref:efflux RND transporter periplasmic adaptor subunit n=1 Tax=Alkalihalobacillus sp. CinArs1 TaxID=2995314 RepID=UPI0022DD96B2|nr:efflux RND transporter periplasmic adaptor subunit [Alkalihalobacillus sp. CinArs1]